MIVNKKRLIVLLGVCVAVFSFAYLFIYHSYYVIKYPSNIPPGEVSVSYIKDDGDEVNATRLFGLTVMPRSAPTIAFKYTDQETRIFTGKKALLWVNSLDVAFINQRKLDKVGKGGLGCSGVSNSQKTFTYNCYGSIDSIFTYANKRVGEYNNKLLGIKLAGSRVVTKPYNGGLLSIGGNSEGATLDFYDIDTETLAQQSLPYKKSDIINLYTEDAGEGFVVVDNSNNELLYYKSLASTPKKMSFSDDLTYTNCAVRAPVVYCIATESNNENKGEIHEDGDGHKANEDLLITDSRLISYNTSTKEQHASTLPTLPKLVCASKNGVYTVDSSDTLRYIQLNSNNIYTVSSDVSSLHCLKDKAFYATSKAFYKIQEGYTQLLFKEDRFNISSIYSDGEHTLIDTFIETSNIVHTYRLTEDNRGKDGVESVLPYTDESSLPIFEMDYDNEYVYIKPVVSVVSDKSTGKTIIDQQALRRTKEDIENVLKSDGVLSNRKVIYYYN